MNNQGVHFILQEYFSIHTCLLKASVYLGLCSESLCKNYSRFSIDFISDKEIADLYNRDNMTGLGHLLAKDIIAVLPGRTPLMDRQGMSFLKAFFSLII